MRKITHEIFCLRERHGISRLLDRCSRPEGEREPQSSVRRCDTLYLAESPRGVWHRYLIHQGIRNVREKERQMATIVFFSQPYYGHTHPTLPVVTELVRRGECVIYYSLEGFQSTIGQTGADFRSYGKAYPFEHEEAYDNQFILYVRFLEVSQLVLEHLLPDIRAEKPDAILYDQLCVWGPALAQLLDVPAISYMTMFVITPWLVLSDPAQLRNRLLSVHLVRKIRALTKQISATYGVRRPSLFEMANNPGQLNIVFTS